LKAYGFAQTGIQFVRRVLAKYGADKGGIIAAAVSFYVFLSFIPLLLIAVAALGTVFGSSHRAQVIVFDYLKSMGFIVPGAIDVREIVTQIAGSSTTVGVVGFAGLLWTGSQAISNLESGLNTVLGIRRSRGFLVSRLVAVVFLLAIGILMTISFGGTALANAVKQWDVTIFGTKPANWPWIWGIISYLIPLVSTMLTFVLIYALLPAKKVGVKAALVGGLTAGILWEIAKQAFSWYLLRFAHYSAVYGSLAGVMLIPIWIHYSSTVTILGAEAVSILRKTPRRD
jgi:membrane protein